MKQIFLNSGTYTYKDLKGKLDLEKYILSVLAKDTCCVKSLKVDSLVSTTGSIPATFIALGATQTLTGNAVVVNLTSYLTRWTTTGVAQTATLADGVVAGQLKKIQMLVDGGDGILTPANLAAGTTITFNDVNDFVILSWGGAEWFVIENSGTTIA
jgi:hypothetical protein